MNLFSSQWLILPFPKILTLLLESPCVLNEGFIYMCVCVCVSVVTHMKMRYLLEILAVVFRWWWDVISLWERCGVMDSWHAWCDWLTLHYHGYHCYCVFCEVCTRARENGCCGDHVCSLWGMHHGRRSTSIKHITHDAFRWAMDISYRVWYVWDTHWGWRNCWVLSR